MFQHVPNAITSARLVLSLVFFGMLSYYQYEGRGDPWLLNIAFLVYAVALFSDFLDGYLARKWKVEGTFGRILDPFVDKVLVIGSFIFFAGKNFVIPEHNIDIARQISRVNPEMVVTTITGVTPWMVVIILSRELLVTSLRGVSEASGQHFGAAFSGKVKMVLQSVTILVILAYVNYHTREWIQPYQNVAAWVRDAFIWATVIVTLVSGLMYVYRAYTLLRTTTPVVSPEK